MTTILRSTAATRWTRLMDSMRGKKRPSLPAYCTGYRAWYLRCIYSLLVARNSLCDARACPQCLLGPNNWCVCRDYTKFGVRESDHSIQGSGKNQGDDKQCETESPSDDLNWFDMSTSCSNSSLLMCRNSPLLPVQTFPFRLRYT